jgi:hypothetical protein
VFWADTIGPTETRIEMIRLTMRDGMIASYDFAPVP